MSKYKITIQDLANYVLLDDLKESEKNRSLNLLFYHYKKELSKRCGDTFLIFKRRVEHEIMCSDFTPQDIMAVNLIYKDMHVKQIKEKDDDNDIISGYFKILKLQVLCSKNHYKRIKLRTLLAKCKYKRRTEKLVNIMNNAIKHLGLKVYLKGYEKCNIREVDIDDMLIFKIY